jgi:hypothetical protein
MQRNCMSKNCENVCYEMPSLSQTRPLIILYGNFVIRKIHKVKTKQGLHLRIVWAYLNAALPAKVSMHPKGPATGQLNTHFPWFFSLLEQCLVCNEIPR